MIAESIEVMLSDNYYLTPGLCLVSSTSYSVLSLTTLGDFLVLVIIYCGTLDKVWSVGTNTTFTPT